MVDLTIKERIMRLETQMKELLTNHLPHLQSDMKSMKNQNAWIIGGVILMLLGIIADIIIR